MVMDGTEAVANVQLTQVQQKKEYYSARTNAYDKNFAGQRTHQQSVSLG